LHLPTLPFSLRAVFRETIMPFVTIRILKGHSQERKDEISRRVTAAVSEIAQLPKDAVWVVFEDVTAEDWYVGGTTVGELKRDGKL
jgi:4-oxalocrotonate tautomerase